MAGVGDYFSALLVVMFPGKRITTNKLISHDSPLQW